MNNTSILMADNLEKTYTSSYGAECKVLKGVSFDIKKGEIISIVGPSGAGKSTLLHILGGLDDPSKGIVHFEGIPLPSYDETSTALIRNQHFGFIFQDPHLLPEFTVLENVFIPAALLYGKKYDKNWCKELLEKIGLNERMEHFPPELSGGEQQRVAVVRAMVNRPKVIFADEPTGNLDKANRIAVYKLLEKLVHELETTLVVVTHEESLPFSQGKKMLLVDGKIEKIEEYS